MAHFPSKVVEFARHKAAELEVSHGLSGTHCCHGNHYIMCIVFPDNEEIMDEPLSKKKRVEVKVSNYLYTC